MQLSMYILTVMIAKACSNDIEIAYYFAQSSLFLLSPYNRYLRGIIDSISETNDWAETLKPTRLFL